jgi:hypothetical protein
MTGTTEQEQRNAQPQQPKKKRRVFPWVFLAIQAIFLIWLIVGIHGNVNHLSSHSAADCRAHNNYFFGSLKECVNTSNSATEVGTTIGAGLVIGLWVATDVIVGGSYLIWRVAKR